MNRTNHTPGPWLAMQTQQTANKLDVLIRSANNTHIAWSYDVDNARLIAAAPELLEALKDAASVLSGENMSKSALIRALEKARTAITKATGEQQ